MYRGRTVCIGSRLCVRAVFTTPTVQVRCTLVRTGVEWSGIKRTRQNQTFHCKVSSINSHIHTYTHTVYAYVCVHILYVCTYVSTYTNILYIRTNIVYVTWIVSTLTGRQTGAHYQRYLLFKVLSMVLHEVGTEQ